MKKIFMMLPLFVAILMTGCSSDDAFESNAPVKPIGDSEFITFSAGIDVDENRITYDENNGRKVYWEESDEITVIDKNGATYTYKVSSIDENNPTIARFASAEEDRGLTEDVLPAKAYYSKTLLDDGKLILPATQVFANGENISNVTPMYAEVTTMNINEPARFYNICGLLRINLKGAEESTDIKRITITADKPLSGEFEIPDSEVIPIAVVTASGNKGVTLECNDPITLSTSEDKSFYIAVPQGEYSHFCVTAYSSGDIPRTYLKPLKAGQKLSITRNTRYNMTYTIDYAEQDPLLPGVFSVGEGKSVQFTRGNLYRTSSDNKFHIESHQYDIKPTLDEYNESGTSWDETHISHFYWRDKNSMAKSYVGTRQVFIPSPWKANTLIDFCFNDNVDVDGRTDLRVLEGCASGSTSTEIGSNEWDYLFNSREAAGKVKAGYSYKDAIVNDVTIGGKVYKGLFIYPDYYSGPAVGTEGANTWIDINKRGIVFLPAAGVRNRINSGGTKVQNIGIECCYWSSTGLYKSNYNVASDGLLMALSYCYIDGALTFNTNLNYIEGTGSNSNYNEKNAFPVRLVKYLGK